ncbi:hypothetical protein IU403_05180 [Aerococcaceae bacterium zg-BR22]|uniref:Lin0368 family putative glycerol transporter subunit n=1 Tax=Aerococcaceae bacterium zg-1292 TaxID=2774330 RepID=UPI0040636BB2|nr:hypothetical protein [Aerococcaceae bacterium zg-BR22]
MNITHVLTTFVGAFLYSFTLNGFFSKFVRSNNYLESFFASMSLIGLFWILNHGISTPFIYQSGPIWIDMAVASGIGVFIHSYLKNCQNSKKSNHVNNINFIIIMNALLGGVISGIIMYLHRLVSL